MANSAFSMAQRVLAEDSVEVAGDDPHRVDTVLPQRE